MAHEFPSASALRAFCSAAQPRFADAAPASGAELTIPAGAPPPATIKATPTAWRGSSATLRVGANGHGLLDVAGNVWEWIGSSLVRTRVDPEGGVLSDVINCGMRLVEDHDRTFVPEVIRDARAGP